MKTPNCLPKNNPHKIPNGTGFIKVAILNPSRETPAFAKAKIGIIPKATYGEIACSSLISIEFLCEFLFSLSLCGIVKANKTPAIVA